MIKWRVTVMAISGHVGELKKVTLIAPPADTPHTLDTETLIPSNMATLTRYDKKDTLNRVI
jgi:hypothetical protein